MRPGRGLDVQRALHPLGELARDREAQARALRVVGREERLEDAGSGVVGGCPGRRRRRRAARTPLSRAAVTTTPVPAGVCVSALSMRIRRIWATRSGSQTASIGSRREPQLERGVVLVERGLELATSPRRASSPRSVASGRSSSEPASSLERSSRSVASLPRRATCSRTTADELAPRLVVELLVLEQLEEAAEREDRRAQLVRGGRDEAPARAVSSSASWRCMSSSARASWPSSSSRSAGKTRGEVARGDLLGALLEALRPGAAIARDTRKPPPSASSSPSAPATRTWRRMSATLSCTSVSGVEKTTTRLTTALVADRLGDLAERARRRGTASRAPRAPCARATSAIATGRSSSCTSRRGVREDRGLQAERPVADDQQRHARARRGRRSSRRAGRPGARAVVEHERRVICGV